MALTSHYPYASPGPSAAEVARDAAVLQMSRALFVAACVAVMIYASNAPSALVFVDIHNPEAESPAARLAWVPLYLLTLALLVLRLPHVLRLVTFAPLLVVCVLVAGLSVMWSVDPALSLRRAVALAMTTSLGLVLAAWLGWSKLIQGAALAFAALALISVAVVLADPARGIMSEVYPGAWRGPWMQKNDLGGMMTKGLIACLGACAVRPGRVWLYGPAALLCFALVLASTSKTALLISVGAVGLAGWIALYRGVAALRPLLWLGLIGGVGGVVAALTLAPEATLGLIGKDPTFTGRTEIWAALRLAIEARPGLGYGYGAFWMDPLGPSYIVREVLEWGVPSAHNGWVEIWLSGGVLLVGVFGAHMVLVLGVLLRRLARGGREIYWAALSLLAFLGFSLSESAILQQNDLTWVLFVAASAKLLAGERMPDQRRRPRDAGIAAMAVALPRRLRLPAPDTSAWPAAVSALPARMAVPVAAPARPVVAPPWTLPRRLDERPLPAVAAQLRQALPPVADIVPLPPAPPPSPPTAPLAEPSLAPMPEATTRVA